jgi:DNA repair exonuclease SbcCD ATPase subunit
VAELRVKKFRMVRKVSLGDGPLSIGRSSSNDVVLASRTVSRQHAMIELVDGSPRIRDLGSSHGTRVNGRRVTEALLYDGDSISIGRFELVFTNAGGPKRPEQAEAEIHTLAVDVDAIAPVPVREQAAADDDDASAAAAAREAAIATERTAMEAERAAWSEQQATTASELQELRAAQSQLEAALAAAKRQGAELRADLEAARSELAQLAAEHAAAVKAREAAERHVADALAERASLGSALLDKDAVIAEHLHRQAAHEHQIEMLMSESQRHVESIDALRAELRSAQLAMEQATRRIAELESELESRRQDAERAHRDLYRKNRELQRKVEELERVSDAAQTMEHQLHETQVMQAIAHERSNVAVRVLQQFESGSQTLQQASKRLAKIMRVIEQLEAQWVECDERMQEVEQLGSSAVDAAVAERDQLAAQLEDANAARDDAIAKLLAQTEQISAVGVSVPEAQALRMPAVTTKSWRSGAARRPWWRFGL